MITPLIGPNSSSSLTSINAASSAAACQSEEKGLAEKVFINLTDIQMDRLSEVLDRPCMLAPSLERVKEEELSFYQKFFPSISLKPIIFKVNELLKFLSERFIDFGLHNQNAELDGGARDYVVSGYEDYEDVDISYKVNEEIDFYHVQNILAEFVLTIALETPVCLKKFNIDRKTKEFFLNFYLKRKKINRFGCEDSPIASFFKLDQIDVNFFLKEDTTLRRHVSKAERLAIGIQTKKISDSSGKIPFQKKIPKVSFNKFLTRFSMFMIVMIRV